MPRDVLTTFNDIPVLVRTDFSDDAAWNELLRSLDDFFIAGTGEELSVFVIVVDDRQYEAMVLDELLAMVPNYDPADPDDPAQLDASVVRVERDKPSRLGYAFVVDAVTLSHIDRPILAVNFYLMHGENFRLTAASLPMIVSNLAIANLSFDDYVGAAEADPEGFARF